MASGCIESIVINGRRFTCDAEDACSITYGGYDNEVKPNGDGTNRLVKSRHAGKIEGLNIITENDRDDQEFLQESQDSLEFFDVSATEIDGTVLGGKMQLTEALANDLKEGSTSITLEGALEKIG